MPMPRYGLRSSLLEWGHLTDEPGSQVRDAKGKMVFTASEVCSCADRLLVGVVRELLSTAEIVVAWAVDDGERCQHLSPLEIQVLVPLPSSS